MGGQLAEKSGGRIVLETYPSGQLGTSNELMNSVTNGTIESCVTSTFGTLEKNIYTVELPYLFSGFDHVKKFMHSEESAQLLSQLCLLYTSPDYRNPCGAGRGRTLKGVGCLLHCGLYKREGFERIVKNYGEKDGKCVANSRNAHKKFRIY